MTLTEVTDESKCCCSCRNNIRTHDKVWGCVCHCEIDGHYIGYVNNFDTVCEEWEKDNERLYQQTGGD